MGGFTSRWAPEGFYMHCVFCLFCGYLYFFMPRFLRVHAAFFFLPDWTPLPHRQFLFLKGGWTMDFCLWRFKNGPNNGSKKMLPSSILDENSILFGLPAGSHTFLGSFSFFFGQLDPIQAQFQSGTPSRRGQGSAERGEMCTVHFCTCLQFLWFGYLAVFFLKSFSASSWGKKLNTKNLV